MIIALSLSAAIVGGGVAAVAGFGIGSLVTPVLAVDLGIKLAVALVAIPHFIATSLRLWALRRHVDWSLFLRFGLASAAGGLAGALLHVYLSATPLGILFGLLLVFAGAASLSGWAERFRLHGAWSPSAGVVSGLLGGLVGNQGGIRSAALLGYDLSKEGFVATATAAAFLVDIARIPVYIAYQGHAVFARWPLMLGLSIAVVAGTFLGWRLLQRIPARLFRRIIGALILALGLYMLYQGPR